MSSTVSTSVSGEVVVIEHKAKKSSRLDTSLLDSKQFAKYAKLTDDKTAKELISLDKQGLERALVDAQLYMEQVCAETNANAVFQKSKETVADFRAGLRDTLKPVVAKVNLLVSALKSLKDNP